ncbi:hypothetical protein KUTeg_001250 [Tegillarca granosa]|uniref:OTU domain-containing protein n=1 Tax=Tegillarca granosa TaxID=220873 RepID=A0ABQ9FWQ2_TEGGR|nr:hypothetical protein KUTeg_001250 [Tegillarca granosa]
MGLRELESETYDTLLKLVKGEFKKPVNLRTRLENNARVLYWRRKEGLYIEKHNGIDILMYEGRRVLTKKNFQKKVSKHVIKSKGGNARALSHTMKQTSSSSGSNWVKRLPDVAEAINNQPKEVLAYQTPFQCYFGRGQNISADVIHKKAKIASERCQKRTVLAQNKKNGCSIYKRGDRVLLKYPFVSSRVPYKRCVLKAKILKRARNFDKYIIVFKDKNNKQIKKWVRVENITSRTKKEELDRRARAKEMFEILEQKRIHRCKYYIPLESSEENICEDTRKQMEIDSEDHCNESEVDIGEQNEQNNRTRYFCGNNKVIISDDPIGDGSCQFGAIVPQIRKLGIHETPEHLRTIAVQHLESNSDHYRNFLCDDRNFESYVKEMRRPYAYGDSGKGV